MIRSLWCARVGLMGLLVILSACPGGQNLPTASFTLSPENGTVPLTVNVDASASSAPGGTVASYAWAWGDGSTGTGRTASHIYNSVGTFSVGLTVCDDQGRCSPQATKSVSVNAQTGGSNNLRFEANQTVNGSSADRVSWRDAGLRPRSAALIHNTAQDARGMRGGYVDQFSYQLTNGSTRTVNGSSGAPGGFGYVVSHLRDASVANGEDDSPLGSGFGGQYRTVFVGAHHALYEYTLNYPRWGINPGSGQKTRYIVPVTIQWLFATGRDHPLWTVSFDLSAAPANAINADSRAPYGDMRFDGASDGGDAIGGVGWGDRYRFTSLGGPLTLSSDWDWSGLNTFAPYHLLWTQTTDAEMGLVGTRPITRQDAGGYEGADGRGSSSANAASRCTTAPTYRMPCDWKWAYQSVNYSFYDGGGQLATNTPTDSKRLAWGADWGFLGQQTYTSVNGFTGSGWPRVSYSTFIVLGTHSSTPTVRLAEQVAVVDATSLSATGATVRTQGLAGAGRTDTVPYNPAGYNHVLSIWEVSATAPSQTLQFTVPAGKSLENPVIVVRNYARATPPSSLKLGGVALQPDTDVFASVVPARQELWITLRKNLTGTSTLSLEP